MVNGQWSIVNGGRLGGGAAVWAGGEGGDVGRCSWRNDRPMVTAEGLANSLRGWAAQEAATAARGGGLSRRGGCGSEARQIVSGLNYQDKELVAALGMLAEEREGERGGEGRRKNGQLSTVNEQLSMEA